MPNNFLENLDLQYKLSTKSLEQSFIDMNPTDFERNFKAIHNYHQKFEQNCSEQSVYKIKDKFYQEFSKHFSLLYEKINHPQFHQILEITNKNLTFLDINKNKSSQFYFFYAFYFFHTQNPNNAFKTFKKLLSPDLNYHHFIIVNHGRALLKNQSDEVFQKCFSLIKQSIKKSPETYDFNVLVSILYYKPTKQKVQIPPTYNPNSFKSFTHQYLKHIFCPKNNIQNLNHKGKVAFANLFFSYLNNIEDINFNSQDKENYHSLLEIYNTHHPSTTFIETVVDLSFCLYENKKDVTLLEKWISYAINSQDHNKTIELFKKLKIPTHLYSNFNEYHHYNLNINPTHTKLNSKIKKI